VDLRRELLGGDLTGQLEERLGNAVVVRRQQAIDRRTHPSDDAIL
jgi:hypothetical protein